MNYCHEHKTCRNLPLSRFFKSLDLTYLPLCNKIIKRSARNDQQEMACNFKREVIRSNVDCLKPYFRQVQVDHQSPPWSRIIQQILEFVAQNKYPPGACVWKITLKLCYRKRYKRKCPTVSRWALNNRKVIQKLNKQYEFFKSISFLISLRVYYPIDTDIFWSIIIAFIIKHWLNLGFPGGIEVWILFAPGAISWGDKIIFITIHLNMIWIIFILPMVTQ